MTHEQNNKINGIADALEDEYISIKNLLDREYFTDAERDALEYNLSNLDIIISNLCNLIRK